MSLQAVPKLSTVNFPSDREYTHNALIEELVLLEKHLRDESWRLCSCNPEKHLPAIAGLGSEGQGFAETDDEKEFMRSLQVQARIWKDRIKKGIFSEKDANTLRAFARESRKRIERKKWVGAVPDSVLKLVEELNDLDFTRENPLSLPEIEDEMAHKMIQHLCKKHKIPMPKQIKFTDSCNPLMPNAVHIQRDQVTKDGIKNRADLDEIIFCRGGLNAFTVAHEFCFTGDTVIFGSNKSISDLIVGDMCLDHNGFEQKITRTYKREYKGQFVELKVSGLPKITMTEDHPILVCNFKKVHVANNPAVYDFVRSPLRWENAKNLVKGDYVAVPRNSELKKPKTISLSKYYKRIQRIEEYHKAIKLKKEHGWGNRKISKTLQVPRSTVLGWISGRHKPRNTIYTLSLDRDLAKFFGLYVAEGSLQFRNRTGRISLAFGSHETDLIEWVSKFSKERLGTKTHVCYQKDSNAVNLVICHKGMAKFLEESFGRGARHKRVPQFIKESPHEIVRGFIEGEYLGDGGLDPDKSMGITTVSKFLAMDLTELLFKIGVTPRLYLPTEKRNSYRIKFSQKVWLNKGVVKVPYSHGLVYDSVVYLPIRSTRAFYDEKTVYNIETGDHTYPVPFIVHNCHYRDHYRGNFMASEVEANTFAVKEIRNRLYTPIDDSNLDIQPTYNNLLGKRMSLKITSVQSKKGLTAVAGLSVAKAIDYFDPQITELLGPVGKPIGKIAVGALAAYYGLTKMTGLAQDFLLFGGTELALSEIFKYVLPTTLALKAPVTARAPVVVPLTPGGAENYPGASSRITAAAPFMRTYSTPTRLTAGYPQVAMADGKAIQIRV